MGRAKQRRMREVEVDITTCDMCGVDEDTPAGTSSLTRIPPAETWLCFYGDGGRHFYFCGWRCMASYASNRSKRVGMAVA